MSSKPKPSNPFLPESNFSDYLPDTQEIERALVDDAVREEVESGRLPGLLLQPAVAARILNVPSNDT